LVTKPILLTSSLPPFGESSLTYLRSEKPGDYYGAPSPPRSKYALEDSDPLIEVFAIRKGRALLLAFHPPLIRNSRFVTKRAGPRTSRFQTLLS
jgi:hypothetical protein